ncbi:probable 3-hydroxyisobutyryl-CoA hydrolase 3 isoform X7 [Primulina huaijiensis]|uniref:probable 3-hydroxyisobutyryl-CoA hydrolase 3 isoform X7 n=1 Tax=Primulina huaijiensis TaxID=1492673 RepID=UPI003CC73EFB
MASISSTNGETDQVSRLLELFIACWEDFAVKLLILKSYLHIWAPWIWCFLLPMLVPEARGNWRSGASSFRKEFTLNYVMATYYSKPQVSILNGIVMGGGAGACFCTCFLLCLKQHWDSSLTCLVLT